MKKWLLPVGFSLIVLFLLTVTAVVVLRMDAINDEVDEIVNQHSVKVEHITNMYTSSRERSVSLLTMTTMEDPFDREDEFDRFNALATTFAVARLALLDMPLNTEEQALLDEQGSLVGLSVPQQERVIALLADDDFNQAEQVLIKHAIPAQNNVLHKLTEMADYQAQAAKGALAHARILYGDTVQVIILLSIVAVILCMGIAWYVIRTLRQRETELKDYSGHLEERVRERTTDLQAAYQDLKNSQAQLVQAEKMASLGQLTAGIAHEIKNPLNFINNFSETSRESVEELVASLGSFRNAIPEKDYRLVDGILDDLRSDLDKIGNHGKRADGIVRSMLMHAREGGNRRESTSVNQLVEDNLNLAYHSERAKNREFNISLVTHLAEDAGEAVVEPQDISRVLVNLFGNSFYATEKKQNLQELSDYEPEVVVKTHRDGEKIWIEIADNGIGMSPEIIEKVFDPFFTTKLTGEGTGLGLSLSFDTIKQVYGGDFEVESREGQGTLFRFSLPVGDSSSV